MGSTKSLGGRVRDSRRSPDRLVDPPLNRPDGRPIDRGVLSGRHRHPLLVKLAATGDGTVSVSHHDTSNHFMAALRSGWWTEGPASASVRFPRLVASRANSRAVRSAADAPMSGKQSGPGAAPDPTPRRRTADPAWSRCHGGFVEGGQGPAPASRTRPTRPRSTRHKRGAVENPSRRRLTMPT